MVLSDTAPDIAVISPKVITDKTDGDPSDFREYATQLSKLIANSNARFTVGIYGGWGTGKSTLMQMIKKRLETAEFKDDIITIWFDAWRFENEKYMAVIPLIRTIKIEIDNRINQTLKNKGSISHGLKKLQDGANKTFLALVKSAKLNASLNYFGANAGVDLDIKEFTDILQSEGSVRIDDEEVHYRKQHITDYLADTVKAFTDENRPKRRIVIFVDDLDRCTPEKAMELLESIKTFFDIEGIIYVLGMDPRTIDPIIKTKYGENSGIEGMDYLQKIVQLPFQVPVWGTVEMSKAIRAMISETGLAPSDVDSIMQDTNIQLIIQTAQLNPRDVKRFINTVILSKIIYGQTAKDFEKLIAIQAFYFRGKKWMEFLSLLMPYKTRVEFLKNFIVLVFGEPERTDFLTLEDLSKLIKEIGSKKYDYPLDKPVQEIFKKLVELNDNDLFIFLRTSATTLIKIGKIERYMRALDTVGIKDSSQIPLDENLDADTDKQLELLINGNAVEFNKIRKQNRTLIHLPFEKIVSRADQNKVKELNLSGVNLKRAFLFRTNWQRADLSVALFHKADLSGAILHEADLSGANLTQANLTGADLSGAILHEADLSGANLTQANLTGADLSDADLSYANLSGAKLQGGSDLSGSTMAYANLTGAKLFLANFSRTNLLGANLTGADLSYAKFIQTDFLRANVSAADLSRACLIRIYNFTTLKTEKTKFDNAIIDDAKLVDYLRDKKNGAQNVPEAVKSKKDLKSKIQGLGYSPDTLEKITSKSKLPE